MQRSESVANLAKSLSHFQSEVSQPKKNSTVSMSYKDSNGQWRKKEYKYSTLDQLIENIKAPMKNNGLSFMQDVDTTDGVKITTLLMHESGEYIQSSPVTFQITDNKPQTIGSLISYGRRYSLSSMLGLASEEDDDAAQAQHPQPVPIAPDGTKPQQGAGATPAQIRLINARIKEVAAAWEKDAAIVKQTLKANLQIESLKNLQRNQVDTAMQMLEGWQEQAQQVS